MTNKDDSIYGKLGVSAGKEEVHGVFDKMITSVYPGSFVKIFWDPWTKGWVMVIHGDGNGSKSVSHIVYYLETKDASLLPNDSADAFVMNAGDIAAAGFFDLVFIDTIDINGHNVDKGLVMNCLSRGIFKTINLHRDHGFKVTVWGGGETADLPDQVKSYVVNMSFFSRMPAFEAIEGNVQEGDIIIGMSSGGKAPWEEKENSGHMSNGSTMSRSQLLIPAYAEKYPFLASDTNPFKGRFKITDYVDELGMTMADALLSPTRQWAIIIKMIVDEMKARHALHLLHGISMNTGGGAKKVANLGQGILYQKKMPEPLPLFQLIQKETGETWKNMFKSFNCGVGVDIVGSPHGGILAETCMWVSEITNIQMHGLGTCSRSKDEKNHVELETPHGTFDY